jgi:chromosome segregation ATPase
MKKFIGNVNGVEYTNREDFNEAVKKAMENPYEQLVVTSYEKIVPDDEPVKKDGEKIIVDTDEITLSRDSEKDENGEYKIEEGIKEKLENCSNKEDVIESLKRDIKNWKRCKEDNDGKIEKCKEDIDFANKRIAELNEDNKTLDAGIRYYNRLLSYVDKDYKNHRQIDNTEKKPYTKPIVKSDTEIMKDNILEIFDSFGKYLKKKGFFL